MLCWTQWLACPSTAIRACRGIRDSHCLSSMDPIQDQWDIKRLEIIIKLIGYNTDGEERSWQALR